MSCQKCKNESLILREALNHCLSFACLEYFSKGYFERLLAQGLTTEEEYLAQVKANASAEINLTASDPFVEANRRLLLARSDVGLRKYGTTLETNPAHSAEWLQHLIEELLDAANYAQVLKARMPPCSLGS